MSEIDNDYNIIGLFLHCVRSYESMIISGNKSRIRNEEKMDSIVTDND